jgi:hypothetical protein
VLICKYHKLKSGYILFIRNLTNKYPPGDNIWKQLTMLMSLHRIGILTTWMEKHNITMLTEFLLVGITDCPELQPPLFGLFLIIYISATVGNLGMIILTKVAPGCRPQCTFFSDTWLSLILVILQLWDPKCWWIVL